MKVPACYALCLMYNAANQSLGIWCIDLCVDLVALFTDILTSLPGTLEQAFICEHLTEAINCIIFSNMHNIGSECLLYILSA